MSQSATASTILASPAIAPRRRLIALAGVITILVSACGATPSPSSSPGATTGPTQATTEPATPSAAPIGGQIVLSQADDPVTLNPATSALATTIIHAQFLFDGLTRPGADLRPGPSLAESWTVSDDGLHYVFKLRSGVTFHDGSPLTSADVKFTWELIDNGANASAAQLAGFFSAVKGAPEYRAGDAKEIVGITTPDPLTVDVVLTRPYAPFLSISAFQPILPKSVYGSIPVADLGKDPTARQPIGTGPFKFVSWTPNDQMVYAANESYWGGRPKIDKLVIKTVAEAASLPGLLRSGTVDLVGITTALTPQDAKSFVGDGSVTIDELKGGWNRYVEFNLVNPLFQDVRVRQAMVFAVDRQSILNDLYLGKGQIVDSPIAPSSWAYSAPTTTYPYDPQRAKDLLAAAGWVPGSDGILTKDGKRFSFEMLTYANWSTDFPLVLQEQWKAVGIDAQLKPEQFAAFFGPVYLAHKHQVVAIQVPIGTYPDPAYPLGGYFNSAFNRNSYKNDRVDALIGIAASALTEADRKAAYAEMTELLAQDVPSFWPVMPNDLWGVSNKVRLPNLDLAFLQFVNAKDWERTSP